MNLLEAYVVEIIGEPYYKYDKIWQKIKYSCYGQMSESSLMFDDLEDLKAVKIGYKFLV